MSSIGTVQVNITARETDLRAELALARADLSKFTGEVRTMSAEMVATGKTADAAMVAGLRAAGTGAAMAGKQVAGLEKELKKLGPAAASGHGSISTATREFRALFDELSSGRTRMTPGTLAIIAQRVFGLSGAALAGAGAVVALAVAIGYVAYKSIEASNALDKLEKTAAFGGLDVSRQQLKQFADEAGADGQEIEAVWVRTGPMVASQLEALTTATAAYADASGEKGSEAAKQFTAILNGEHVSLAQLQKMFPATTEAERENFQAVQQLGDAHQTTQALVRLLDEQMSGMHTTLIQNSDGWHTTGGAIRLVAGYIQQVTGSFLPLSSAIEGSIQLVDKWGGAIASATAWVGRLASAIPGAKAAIESLNPVAQVQAHLEEEATKKLDARTAAMNRSATATAAAKSSAEATITSGMRASEAFGTETKHAEELTSAIKRMQAAQNAPGVTPKEKATLGSSIADAQRQETEAAKRAKTEEFENFSAMENAKADAAKSGSAARIQAAQDEVNKAKQLFGNESTEYYEAVGRLNSAKREGAQAGATAARQGGQQEIADAREKISEIQADDKLSAAQREAQEKAVWTNLLATAKLSSAQRVDIQREMNSELMQAQRAEKAQATEISRNNASTDLEIAKIGFQQKRDELEQEVQAAQITKMQEIEQLKSVAKAELAANIAMLNSTETTKDADLAAWTRTENQKRILVAQTKAEIAKLNDDMAAEARKAALEDAKSWTMSIDEITGAERTMVGGLLSGRENLYQASAQASSQLIQKELEDDLAYYTKKLLLGNEAFAAEQAHEQGGILVHALSESSKTAATTTGTTTRTALGATEEATENASFLVRAGRWIASELGMTAATTTGTATRTTEQASAASAQKVAESAANVASAQSYAAVAATGAASAVAPIPIIGPELAVAAATSTMAVLQPFVGLAALDVGAWSIPHDMPAMIHKGESVVPKTFAEGLRSNGGFGGAGNNTTNTLNAHYSPTINAPQQKSLGQMLSDDGSTFKSWFSAQMRSGALRMR